MQARVDEIIQELLNGLDQHDLLDKIEMMMLFGSRARGDAEERSDIDIAISARLLTSKEWLLIDDIVENLNTLLEVQVVNYDQSPKALQQNITTEGKLIYEQTKS